MKRAAGGFIMIAAGLCSIGALASESAYGSIVINEISWAGTAWSPRAEWIELFNPSSEPIALDGWRMVSSDGSPDIELSGTIPARVVGDPSSGFFLLERDSDDSVPGIAADLIYAGALNDRGEGLYLLDPQGDLVDSANASASGPWPAGTDAHGVPAYASMERVDWRLPDAPGAWATPSVEPFAASDQRPVLGTPRGENATFNIPPSASFEFAPRVPSPGVAVEFDASGSFDGNDRVVSYRWDFGDGTEGSGAAASHAYDPSGDYRVVLTVVDEKGATSALARTIRVQVASPPVADFSVMALPPQRILRAGSPARFQDESSDIGGEIVAREWTFGDGTAALGASIEHTYDRAGTYLIRLLVMDDQGEWTVQTQSLTIASRIPTARFVATPERPNPTDPVRLDASTSFDPDGRVAHYHWDLDGHGVFELITADPIVEHAFVAAGTHSVGLVVVDDSEDPSEPSVEEIRVNALPIAAFRLSTFESPELVPICFTDLSHDEDGTIAAREWDFGDGSTSEERDPVHAYEDDGTFCVSLTVADDNGAQRTTSATVTIANLPPTAGLACPFATQPTATVFPLDASGSADPSPHGSIAQFEWDLDGDGTFDRTSDSPILSHAFADDGIYEVRVRVADDDGATAVSAPLSLRVTNRPPQVDRITWAPEAPDDATDVCFAVAAHDPDGRIVQWFWDFGDEVVVIGSGPTVRFPDDGRHTVLLSVEDDDGARSVPLAVEVAVANAAPVAEFALTRSEGRCVGFDARRSRDPSPTGEILHIAWDFGDGTSCPGTLGACSRDRLAPLHCYSRPGTYLVTLVIIDEQGGLARSTQAVLIPE